jgi:hypothetical protein
MHLVQLNCFTWRAQTNATKGVISNHHVSTRWQLMQSDFEISGKQLPGNGRHANPRPEVGWQASANKSSCEEASAGREQALVGLAPAGLARLQARLAPSRPCPAQHWLVLPASTYVEI